MPLTIIQIDEPDFLDAFAKRAELQGELNVYRQWELWLVAEIASLREEVNLEYQIRSYQAAELVAKGASAAIEEMERKLGWVRGEMKRVSNLGKGRDPQQNSQGECSAIGAK